MKHPASQSNFLSYLIILAAFFIVVFFTRDAYTQMQIARDEKANIDAQLQEQREYLAELNALEAQLAAEDSQLLSEAYGLHQQVNESEILEYIYSYAQNISSGTDRMIIRDISISPVSRTDQGFYKSDIQVSLVTSSENMLFNFLSFLTSPEQDYTFFIERFSYPMNQASVNIQATIPLTLYFK